MSASDRNSSAFDDEALRRDYAANVDNRLQAAMLGLLALAAALYAPVMAGLVERFGISSVAGAMSIGVIVSGCLATTHTQRGMRVVIAGLAFAAIYFDDPAPLRLIAGGIHAVLAFQFASSLRGGQTIVEVAARTIQPAAPDFIGAYCRGVTAIWGAIFAINAIVLTALAIFGDGHAWQTAAGVGVWSWMAAVTVAEFLVRKTYFRNYWYMGPFERVWSRLFPSENTVMGRRSAAHIREVRARLGL